MTNRRFLGHLGVIAVLAACLSTAACSDGGGNSPGGSAGTGSLQTASHFCETVCGKMATTCTDMDKSECISSCREQHSVPGECAALDNQLADCIGANGSVTCTPPTVKTPDTACGSAENAVDDCVFGSGGSSSSGGTTSGGGS